MSDPLGLIAIENGLVPSPLVDAAAAGNNSLDVAQRAAVIGEPIPIVFARRVGDYGGVLISPAATECRFVNDSKNTLTTSYHLVLGEGQMDSLQVRDVFQGPCRVGSFSQAYSIRAGTWAPGNYITDPSYGYSCWFGFTPDSFDIPPPSFTDEGGNYIRQFNSIAMTEVFSVSQLGAYPFVSSGLAGEVNYVWTQATLIPAFADAPEDVASYQVIVNGIYQVPNFRKLIKAVTYPVPQASTYCGTVGLYTGLSTLSYQITTGSGNDFWQKQVHCFIRGGMHVPRLVDGITGPSNNFADLWQWSLINISKQPASAIDTSRLTAAANFLNVNNLTCDIWLQESNNLEDFVASKAASFLLAQTRVNGQRGLRPLLPVNNDHTIKTTAIGWVFLFNEDYIIPETFEISFTPLADRLPFAVKVLWRQQLDDDFGIIRTSEVRYPGEAIDGPFEQHDLSAFCTRESHAVKVGAYIRARRRWVTHTASWTTRAEDFNTTLVQGDIVRVRLDRIVSANSSKAHDYLYQVDRITVTQAGDVQIQATHFPIDSQGRSLVALDVVNTVGNGILLSSNRTGVSCDLNSSTDTSVPASTSTAGASLDDDVNAGGENGGQAMEGTPEESPGTGPDTTGQNPTDLLDATPIDSLQRDPDTCQFIEPTCTSGRWIIGALDRNGDPIPNTTRIFSGNTGLPMDMNWNYKEITYECLSTSQLSPTTSVTTDTCTPANPPAFNRNNYTYFRIRIYRWSTGLEDHRQDFYATDPISGTQWFTTSEWNNIELIVANTSAAQGGDGLAGIIVQGGGLWNLEGRAYDAGGNGGFCGIYRFRGQTSSGTTLSIQNSFTVTWDNVAPGVYPLDSACSSYFEFSNNQSTILATRTNAA